MRTKDRKKTGRRRKITTVLIGVLKSKRDLEILKREHWYRIPAAHWSKQKFKYLAFYQPEVFGRAGKRIVYYARALSHQIMRRVDLLPGEPQHEKASENYVRVEVGQLKRLDPPIKNTSPRRVSFGFTSLKLLRQARNLLQLYEVAETEEIVAETLKKLNIKFISQHWVRASGNRYRLDFAILCGKGKIAIECDNQKAHHSARQLERDRIKDKKLAAANWTVLRLIEKDIMAGDKKWLGEVKRTIRKIS